MPFTRYIQVCVARPWTSLSGKATSCYPHLSKSRTFLLSHCQRVQQRTNPHFWPPASLLDSSLQDYLEIMWHPSSNPGYVEIAAAQKLYNISTNKRCNCRHCCLPLSRTLLQTSCTLCIIYIPCTPLNPCPKLNSRSVGSSLHKILYNLLFLASPAFSAIIPVKKKCFPFLTRTPLLSWLRAINLFAGHDCIWWNSPNPTKQNVFLHSYKKRLDLTPTIYCCITRLYRHKRFIFSFLTRIHLCSIGFGLSPPWQHITRWNSPNPTEQKVFLYKKRLYLTPAPKVSLVYTWY